MPRIFSLSPLWLLLAVAGTASNAVAQGYARMYLNAPKDIHMTMFTYLNTRSNTEGDLDISKPGSEALINVGSVSYARIMSLFGRTGGPGFSIPYLSFDSVDSGTGNTLVELEGWGDPSFTFDINVFGADAMPREEFILAPPRTYLSLHFAAGTPWGDYDAGRLFNPGGNRWTGKAILNYSLTGDAGWSWLDFYAGVKVFGDNENYYPQRERSQEPVWSLEAYYSRNLTSGIWIGAGMAYSHGGQIAVDGLETGTEQNSLKGVASAGFRLWKGATGILSYNHTVVRPDEAPKEGTVMLQCIITF